MRTTSIKTRHPLTQTENVQSLLLRFDLVTHFVDVTDQADIGLDEGEFAVRVEGAAFRRNSIAGALRAADEVDARFESVLCEGFEGRFADAAGCADEEGDETWGKGGGDEGIGGADGGEWNHSRSYTVRR